MRSELQLFFANMPAPRKPKPPKRPTHASRIVLDAAAIEASRWEQPELFHIDPDPELLRRATTAGARDWTDLTDGIVFEHAERFGWSTQQTNQVRGSLKISQPIRLPGSSSIRASEVLRLRRYDSNPKRIATLDVLAVADLLVDDRAPTIEHHLAAKTTGLPPVMAEQLAVWFDVMLHGSATPPRRRPRDDETTRTLILGIAPILHAWTDALLDTTSTILGRPGTALGAPDPQGPQARLRRLDAEAARGRHVLLDPAAAGPAAVRAALGHLALREEIPAARTRTLD